MKTPQNVTSSTNSTSSTSSASMSSIQLHELRSAPMLEALEPTTPKPKQQRSKPRRIDWRSRVFGGYVDDLRSLLPRLEPGGRKDHPNMTKEELTHLYNQARAAITGRISTRGPNYVAKVAQGRIRVKRATVMYLSKALKCNARQRAILEELAGYEGLYRLLAKELGIAKPNILAYFEDGQQRPNPKELEELVEMWLQTTVTDLKQRLNGEDNAKSSSQPRTRPLPT